MSSARSPRTRARDLDRTEVCGLLDSGYADGQLDAEEHRSRTAAAAAAKTLGELRELVEDLQLDKPLPDLRERAPQGPQRPRRPLVAGIAALALLGVGFGVGQLSTPASPVGPNGTPIVVGGPPAAPIVIGPTALHTPAGLRALIDGVRTQLGTTLVADVTVYPDYASVDVPVPSAPARAQSYYYKGGFDGPNTAGSRDPDDPLVDLATIDVDKILGLLTGAGQSLHVENPTVHYLIIRDNGKGPRVAIYASNKDTGQSGYLEAKPDGTVTGVHPYERR
ncbi:DUF1707 SHOCT-like domain-containing protein [Pseudonocardia sp. CA-107938]|uniref:DUF1707 SHOCT-like domain-containing protein n=1 Tax=Pseudonocardia sp. CA-107938 TaxID=3240021 RepID=UPI003D8FF54A